MGRRMKGNFNSPRSFADKWSDFQDSLAELREACERYDHGESRKVRQIALQLYFLCSGGGGSSVLGRLGIADDLRVPEAKLTRSKPANTNEQPLRITTVSRPLDDGGILDLAGVPLADIVPFQPIGQGHHLAFMPKLHRVLPCGRTTFRRWWREQVYVPKDGLALTRERLVLVMRSQDGAGGHSDDYIRDEAYFLLEDMGSPYLHYFQTPKGLLLKIGNDDLHIVDRVPLALEAVPQPTAGPFPILGGRHASVRHMAWELDVALRDRGY